MQRELSAGVRKREFFVRIHPRAAWLKTGRLRRVRALKRQSIFTRRGCTREGAVNRGGNTIIRPLPKGRGLFYFYVKGKNYYDDL